MSPTSALPQEVYRLALHYLLELSADVHTAAFVERDGTLLAFVPETPGGEARALVAQLAGEANAIAREAGSDAVEVDVTSEGGGVFVVVDGGLSMVCATRRAVLAGLIFHDMHAVLADLARAASQGSRRAETAVVRPGEAS
jgi:hypothetical protein